MLWKKISKIAQMWWRVNVEGEPNDDRDSERERRDGHWCEGSDGEPGDDSEGEKSVMGADAAIFSFTYLKKKIR